MKALGALLIAVGVLALARVVTGERVASAPAAALSPLATNLVFYSVTPPVRELDRGLPANRTVFRLPAWLDQPDYPGLVRPVNPPRPVPPAVGSLPRHTPLILPVLPPRRAD
ncbi:MAG: hypothetical protein ABSC03_16040 [Verrucomicrobiota bacterium]|jgi:hypothetical protein